MRYHQSLLHDSLLRNYLTDRKPLLFWSTACFVGLAVNNLLLFLDLVLLPTIDLRWARNLSALAAVSVLLYSFIWEADRP
jgi:Family of unknown function (DUF5985)